MTDPVSKITVDDGTLIVDVDGYATLDLTEQFLPLAGGSKVTRFLNGTAIKQTNWQKWQIVITGSGWAPSGLWNIDYKLPLTLTVTTPTGTAQYTVFAKRPNEKWDVHAKTPFNWTLTCEEV